MALNDSKGRNLLTLPLGPNSEGAGALHAVTLVDPEGAPLSTNPFTQHRTDVWTLGTPSLTWAINHGLHCFPAVAVVDADGVTGIPDVNYHRDDPDLAGIVITLTFGRPFTGSAFLN